MSDASKKTTVAVTLISVAATIAVLSALYWRRVRIARQENQTLRGVSEILSECNARMRDIQSQLGSVPSPSHHEG